MRWPVTTGDTRKTLPSSTSTGTLLSEFHPLNSWKPTLRSLSLGVRTIAAVVKKAHQRLVFLWVLRRTCTEEKLSEAFSASPLRVFWCTVSQCGTLAAQQQTRAVQRVINNAQRTSGCTLPSLEDISSSLCLSRAKKIIKESSHPEQHLFNLLPLSRWYRCITSWTNRLKNNFIPWAIWTLNCCK